MTVYNSTPQDDSNLDVTVTESTDLVTIDITPASFTATGAAVTSVNSKTGAVILDTDDIDEGATNKYHNDSTVNSLIDTRVDQAFVNALDVDAFTLDGNSSSYFLNYDNFSNTPTIPTNNNELTNGAGYITDYTVTESDVTTHEAALTITESQISDLQSYITASSTDTLTNKSGDISQWTNDAGYLTSESDSQTLSFVSPDLTISNGNTVDLSDLVGDSFDQDLNTTDDVNFESVTADIFGVSYFTAKARETISAGQPVYISGHSGNTPEVMIAEFDDDAKMPSFGIASADISNNNNGSIATYGDLKSIDTTGSNEGETWVVGDTLYVNNGQLTNTRPTDSSENVQAIAKIIRVHANNGQLFLMGAGRTNDVPNLNSGEVFIGNGSGYESREIEYGDLSDDPHFVTDTKFVFETEYSNPAWSAYNGRFKIANWTDSSNNLLNNMNFYTENDHSFLALNVLDTGTGDDGTHEINLTMIGDSNQIQSELADQSGLAYLRINASEINFYDAYSFPDSDGNVDQVLTTDGNGALTWEDGGGGGGALDDLDDVSITSPSDGDIIRYNGTASEFQNTNLGLTLTPTISFPSSVYAGLAVVVTITNWASYDDPNAWAQVVDSSGNVVVTNSQMTDNDDGTLTFNTPAAGTNYEIQVKVQDFGDLASDTATNTFDSTTFGGNFRYWRITDFTGVNTNNVAILKWMLYDTSGQTGTIYPAIMTADNLPTPYVATSSFCHSSYNNYSAFNRVYGAWWTLGGPNQSNPGVDWLQIDLGTARHIKSMYISLWNWSLGGFAGATIYGSNTGSFTGEETNIITFTGMSTSQLDFNIG